MKLYQAQRQSNRLADALPKRGLLFPGGATDADVFRLARIYEALSYHISKAQRKPVNKTTINCLLSDMYDEASAAIAQDSAAAPGAWVTPDWATPAVVAAGRDSVLDHLRRHSSWASGLKKADFDAFFHQQLLARDLWFIYRHGNLTAAECAKEIASRSDLMRSVNGLLGLCKAKGDEWAAEFCNMCRHGKEEAVDETVRGQEETSADAESQENLDEYLNAALNFNDHDDAMDLDMEEEEPVMGTSTSAIGYGTEMDID